jgi:hypothetical protein
MLNWVVLTHKVALERSAKVAITGITQTTPPVITCSGHIYVAGDLVTIEDVVGMTQLNNGMFTVQAVSGSATITIYDLKGSAIPGLGYSGYSSGGYVYRSPGNDWNFIYDIPSDCIRPISVIDEAWGENDSYSWKKEKTWVYTNVSYAALKYLRKVTTVTQWNDELVELMAARLAWLIAPRITQDTSIHQSLLTEWQMAYTRAKISNSADQRQVQPPSTLWTSIR